MHHMQTQTLAIQRIMPIIGKSVKNFRFAFLPKITEVNVVFSLSEFPLFFLPRMTNHSIGVTGQMKPADNGSSPYHRKSQSLDAATIAAQLTNGASGATNVNKRKTYANNEK